MNMKQKDSVICRKLSLIIKYDNVRTVYYDVSWEQIIEWLTDYLMNEEMLLKYEIYKYFVKKKSYSLWSSYFPWFFWYKHEKK